MMKAMTNLQAQEITIFAVVDALTRISGKLANAGGRSEVDQKASALLSLAK